ncbi:MAG TPA: two-component regulator propeller domain-containing protein [Pyrinomonadaceae bacterium]|nr:two-component regulator propeller domain-containing protein [Pyrinomonadaceae bacterium]
MRALRPSNAGFSAAIFTLLFLAFGLFAAQEPSPSPAPSPAVLPTISPTPIVVRSPSPTPDLAEQNFHRWGSITVFNGLPSDAVHAIVQTSDGIMWFGTDNGLARFDGRRVERITLGEEAANRVLCLTADVTSDALYVGTESGAFLYSDGRLRPIYGTEGVGVRSIALSRSAFLGTDSGTLLIANDRLGDTITATKLAVDPLTNVDGTAARITSILVSKDEEITIGTYGKGLLRLDRSSFTELGPAGRPVFVNGVAPDPNGGFWIAADAKKGQAGIFHLTDRLDKLPAETGVATAVAVTDDQLWVGTDRVGVVHVNGKKTEGLSFSTTSGGLRSDTAFSIFIDREGVVWSGTNRGVSRYDPAAPTPETMADLPNRNFVRTLSQSDDGKARLLGTNRGLLRWDGKKWNVISSLADRTIYAIGKSADALVVGTPDGIFDGNGRLVLDGDCRAIQDFQGNNYAAVNGRGVVRLDNRSLVLNDPTASALQTSSRGLLIGTANGLFLYDGKQTLPLVGSDRLKSGTIWKIFESAGQAIWVAGQHGVFVVREGQVEQVAAVEDVRDVFVDGENVWAATATRGLMHARRVGEFGWVVTTLGFEQGMPSEKAFALMPLGDEMVVGTNRGLVHVRQNAIAPKVVAVRVLSQRLHDLRELASPIALDYPQRSVLIEIAGLSSRTFPEEFQYAYLLKNVKGEVIDRRVTHDPQYAPADLSAGEYSIEARAINRDLLISDPLLIHFSVARAPFPWTAAALGILLILAIVGLVIAVVEHRRIRSRNRDLAAARLDLANEAERERRRIARDLHDQTLADLRQLLMRADEMHAAGLRAEIETISGEIRRICEDLSPSVLENVGLVAALEHLLTSTFSDSTFDSAPTVEERLAFSTNVQLQIYRIAQEVLTNIRLHSDAKKVVMRVAVEDERFILSIGDDGAKFIPESVKPHGRGIANIRARAGLIGGKVDWTSDAGRNRFTLTIRT